MSSAPPAKSRGSSQPIQKATRLQRETCVVPVVGGWILAFLTVAWRLLNQLMNKIEFDALETVWKKKLKFCMLPKNNQHRHYEETFKLAAVEFLDANGSSIEVAAAELGVEPSDLRTWKRKLGARNKAVKTVSSMAQLRAENEALRNQIVHLQVQWDILKTTLGVLSTTVCSRDSA
jgi:transposase-like protein